ncbi:MAG: glycosyltransferase family 4 protein, partial [Verrucomicrobiae bacterium]|nr:glycosyltransferase family 4 protein [Verrucomicrobiae bacterium]
MKKKKIVITHHWLMSMRGGERTLEAMAELFPEAPIYAIAGRRAELSAALQAREIHFSMLQHWP